MRKSTTTWSRLTLLWCTTCNLMITLQLLGDLDHLGRVHVRHREDHVEDQGDPHRRHRCQCSCRRDWGVQFVFFHIIVYVWFLNDSVDDMIDKTFIISSLFILTLSVFYTISFKLQVPVWNDTVANLTLMALGERVTPHLIDPLDLLRCLDHLGHVGHLGHLGDPHVSFSRSFVNCYSL